MGAGDAGLWHWGSRARTGAELMPQTPACQAIKTRESCLLLALCVCSAPICLCQWWELGMEGEPCCCCCCSKPLVCSADTASCTEGMQGRIHIPLPRLHSRNTGPGGEKTREERKTRFNFLSAVCTGLGLPHRWHQEIPLSLESRTTW